MASDTVLRLAQDLEWLGCELERYGHQHTQEGSPGAGSTWDLFLAKQRSVIATAEKIERELKNAVRYNPSSLVGVDYPLAATLDSIASLLAAVDDIKQSAVHSVDDLPAKVRDFTEMVQNQFNPSGTADE